MESACGFGKLQSKVGGSFKNIILANPQIKYFRGLVGISVKANVG